MTESSYYESDALWHAGGFASIDHRDRFALCTALIPDDATTLLDVGAGQGAFLEWVSSERPELKIRGIERSRSAIAAASVPIDEGSIEALTEPDRSSDVVTALEVLEHLPYGVYEAGLAELARVARTTIVISVPYAERRAQVECPHCNCRFHPSYHMRSFEPASFGTLFDGWTLDRQEVVHFDDYFGGPLLRWTYRTLRGGANDMPPGTLCPQCGYRPAQAASSRLWARNRVKRRLPVRRRPRWLIGRFIRA